MNCPRISQALSRKLLFTPASAIETHTGEGGTPCGTVHAATCGRYGMSPRPSLQYRTIHGHRRAFRIAGSGPVILMLHGVGDNSKTWEPVHAKLAQRFTVIKPRADYSLAAFANGLRDLLTALGVDRVTVVGHSFGGGLATQFAYQYPQFVERVVLVSAGGVAKDVSIALRSAAMPMGAEALSALRVPGAVPALKLVSRAVRNVMGTTRFTRDVASLPRPICGLRKSGAVAAFARTLRGVVDTRGQFVTMLDRSYLLQELPVQIIWGEGDLIIPVSHARLAHDEIPGSRLEIFEKSGHMPHGDHPDRIVKVVEQFYRLDRTVLLRPGHASYGTANGHPSVRQQ